MTNRTFAPYWNANQNAVTIATFDMPSHDSHSHILCLSIRKFRVFAFDLSCLFYFSRFFFKLCSFFCLFGYFFANKLRRMFTIVKMQKNVFSKWIKKMKRWLKVSISITAMLVSRNAFNFQMAENQRWKWK